LKNLALYAAVAWLFVVGAAAAVAGPGTARPFVAAALAAGVQTPQEPSASLERHAQAAAPVATSEKPARAKAGAITEIQIYDGIKLSLDYASIVDEKQLLLEFTIVNRGSAPVLSIITARDSSVGIHGEAKPRPFKVEALATCPFYQVRATEQCMKRTPDEQWTLLSPNEPYQFQIATVAKPPKIESGSAFAKIRILFRQGKETVFRDASFARIQLGD
jgi:hypothetical protein